MSSTPAEGPAQAPDLSPRKRATSQMESHRAENGDGQQPDTDYTGQIDSAPPAADSTNAEAFTLIENGHRGINTEDERATPLIPKADRPSSNDSDPATRLEAMTNERKDLRAKVEQLRKQLEGLQQHHQQELSQLRAELEESNSAKDHAEEQYQNLFSRVEKIKESLSDRLKRDKAELEEARERIEELETKNEELLASSRSSAIEMESIRVELQDATRELATLRSRNNLSNHNWQREKDELTKSVQHLKQEMETTSIAMGEWEVLAMEERAIKESLTDRVSELEEQVSVLRQGYESATADRDSQALLVDNLQNALREIQEARKKELREMVETTEAQLQVQKQLAQDAQARMTEAEEAREAMSKELERTTPFEREVKEKNLLIGKLRHEAIVLNDHLTKALRYLKKTKPEDNVDRQVITNHLLHFLTLDRGDAKRFQVLQVMAGYLNWSDEQREQAGLSRPGGSSGTLRLSASPFHRPPSSSSLSTDLFTEPAYPRDKESLAELWASFLERSAQEGVAEVPVPPSQEDKSSEPATSLENLEPGG